MFVDVLKRPEGDKVFKWEDHTDETETQAVAEYLAAYAQEWRQSCHFVNNHDGSATLYNSTIVYGDYVLTMYTGQWYVVEMVTTGVTPTPLTPQQVNERFMPYPDYPPVFHTIMDSDQAAPET